MLSRTQRIILQLVMVGPGILLMLFMIFLIIATFFATILGGDGTDLGKKIIAVLETSFVLFGIFSLMSSILIPVATLKNHRLIRYVLILGLFCYCVVDILLFRESRHGWSPPPTLIIMLNWTFFVSPFIAIWNMLRLFTDPFNNIGSHQDS